MHVSGIPPGVPWRWGYFWVSSVKRFLHAKQARGAVSSRHSQSSSRAGTGATCPAVAQATSDAAPDADKSVVLCCLLGQKSYWTNVLMSLCLPTALHHPWAAPLGHFHMPDRTRTSADTTKSRAFFFNFALHPERASPGLSPENHQLVLLNTATLPTPPLRLLITLTRPVTQNPPTFRIIRPLHHGRNDQRRDGEGAVAAQRRP